jgi:hypothetical protein
MKKRIVPVFALSAIATLPMALPVSTRAADTPGKATLAPSTPVPATREIRVALNGFKNAKTDAAVTVLPVPEYADAAFYREVNELALRHDVVITDGFRVYPDGAEAGISYSTGGPSALEERFAQFNPGAVECLAINLPHQKGADASPGFTVIDTIEGRFDILGVNRVLVLRGRNTDDGLEKKLEAMGFTRTGEKSLRVSITPPTPGDTAFSSGFPFVYKIRNSPGRTAFTGPLGCFAIDDAPAFNNSSCLWGLFFHTGRNRT